MKVAKYIERVFPHMLRKPNLYAQSWESLEDMVLTNVQHWLIDMGADDDYVQKTMQRFSTYVGDARPLSTVLHMGRGFQKREEFLQTLEGFWDQERAIFENKLRLEKKARLREEDPR